MNVCLMVEKGSVSWQSTLIYVEFLGLYPHVTPSRFSVLCSLSCVVCVPVTMDACLDGRKSSRRGGVCVCFLSCVVCVFSVVCCGQSHYLYCTINQYGYVFLFIMHLHLIQF